MRSGAPHRVPRSRWKWVAGAAAVGALLSSGCGGTSAAEDAGDRPARAEPTTSSPIDPGGPSRAFDGSTEEFYAPPDPLGPGSPGELLRYQDLGAGDGQRTYRVMYRSTDRTGADRAVTGIVTAPEGAAPDRGWPVVSYGHSSAGVSTSCAPSRQGLPAPAWGVSGVAAATDYVGLGPVGETHPYLSRQAEGNAMIDIVIAAAGLPGADTSGQWVAVGHSQGGHAALAARELAGTRAPELDLAAAVAVAPGVLTDRSWGPTDRALMDLLTILQLHGAAAGDEAIELSDYVTGGVMEATAVLDTGCVDEIVNSMAPVFGSSPFAKDPWETEPARSALEDNEVGSVIVPEVPLMIVSGGADTTVLPERVDALVELLCADPGFIGREDFPDADHGSVVVLATGTIAGFLDSALEGSTADGTQVDDSRLAEDCGS